MSLQPFQPAAQGASGTLGESGTLGQSGALGAGDTQQYQAQQNQNLAAITAAQEQQAQQDQAKEKDSSKGWSLNPFQDIGQVWHDVETHTISPAFKAINWTITNLIKRPYTAATLYSAKNEYDASQGDANWSWWKGSQWAQAWKDSAHVSPGQATLVVMQDQQGITWKDNTRVDPQDTTAIHNYISNSGGNKFASGAIDAAVDWYGDPSNHITKMAAGLKDFKNAPILKTDTVAQRLDKLNSPSSQAFNQAAVNMPYNVLAEHPLIKGTASSPNPLRYETAALVANAKTPDEVNLIRQVLAQIPEAVNAVSNAAEVPGVVDTSAKALDKLAQTNADLAAQASNMLMPLEITEKYALDAGSEADRETWLRKAAQTKAQAAQANVDLDPETAARIAKLIGQQRDITRVSAISNRLAEIRGNMKYANTRDVPVLHMIHNSPFAFPIRMYQSLTDRVPGLINHNQDNAVEYARTWLNKSSTLTPDQKVDYIQRYANATTAQRQQVWTDIENDVYNKVADRFGLPQSQMAKILTTTRKKGETIFQAAKTRAYGELKFQDSDGQAILPTPDEDVILHPQLITQLEAGAQPLANLKQLENALERMQDTGLMAPLRNSYAASKDMLGYLLDNVYGAWKPSVLMTGHRVFNHVGDDYLRGVAKVGALASLRNLGKGTADFFYNNYARLSRNAVIGNPIAMHEQSVAIAKAEYEGLLNQYKTQKAWRVGVPEDVRITPAQVAEKKQYYTTLKNLKLDFIPQNHRIGEGSFKIPGSNLSYDEAFGGPNGDYQRYATSSHPTFMATVGGAAKMTHAVQMAIRGGGFASIKATDNVEQHTAAYVHYIRNQMMPDPAASQIVRGASLDDVSKWMTSTSAGRSYMKALHVGDPDVKVNELATMVKTYLPTDAMREAAATGKFKASTIFDNLPDAGVRPDINANVAALVHGGDGASNILRRSSDWLMNMTGTMPDDILVRHPLYNTLYKSRLTDDVQSWINQTGKDISDQATLDRIVAGAHLATRKDLQNLVYDTSRFNDMGHTLRFVSPFFNAWFNAMSTWSRLIIENPGLIGRGYQAKRALWNSPFAINNQTGKQADVNTPWDQTSFVMHLPKGVANALIGSDTIKDLGKATFMTGMGSVPIDAKTLISPTYVDAIGNPGFGPLVAIPANQIVKDHPSLMNDAVVRSMLNNMVDKNSMQQLLPSGVNDIVSLTNLFTGSPDASSQYAKNVWSIYQEQYYDYLNGQRQSKPNWGDVETQAKYLTVVDLFANRLSPLGFKPAGAHQYLIDEYRRMQSEDSKNAQQNFYDTHGKAGMVFTQSLSTDPSGIAATVGASKAVQKYADLLKQYPELGGAIVGPDGNGNFDQMAYDWQVTKGFRKALSPQEAAAHANVNMGWAQYGKLYAQAQSLLAARGLQSINDPQARDIKATLSNFVAASGDPNDQQNYNPDFFANYGAFNSNEYTGRMQALAQIAQDPALLANPARSDIRSLHNYIQVRDTVYAALQQRRAKTLNASSNADLAQMYDIKVAQMMQDDSKFAQLYDRFLRKDDWKEPL